MLLGNMSYLKSLSPFKSFLFATAATSFLLAPAALAQSNSAYPGVVVKQDPISGITPTYSATQSLPGLSADAIAADVVSNFDPLTGRTEYMAQDFDPFEQDNRIAGTARLRSASSGISRDGASINGGAYLDVSVLYTSESRDPWDGKRLEHAVYMNGAPVDVMTYDIQTLDCQRDITYVSYDDSYYHGASYGYLGGLYRPFPRYRGSSRYYREYDRIRYGAWRGLRNNYVDYRGYDNRIERRRRPGLTERILDRVVGETEVENEIITPRSGRSGRTGPINSDRARERELIMQMRDQQAISSRNVIAPDRLGERRMSNGVSGVDPRPIGSSTPSGFGGSSSSSSTATPTIRQRDGRGLSSRIARRAEEIERARDSATRAGVPRLSNATPRLGTRSVPAVRESQPRTALPTRRTPTRSTTTRSTPRAAAPASNRSSESRPAPTSRSNNSSERSRSNRSSSSRSNNRSSNRSSSSRSKDRASSSRPTRSVNESFGGRNKSTPRSRRYYSGQTDRYEQSRCMKEERLSLHIPAERLQAARFDGLSVVLLDQYGEDVPVYIPPNYIEGFSKANPYLGYYRSHTAQPAPYGHAQPVPYSGTQPAHSGYPTNPTR